MAFSWFPVYKACAFDMAIFGFLRGGERNSSHNGLAWQLLCPSSPSLLLPPPQRLQDEGSRPLSIPLPPATLLPPAPRSYSFCRPHPLACLFIQSWENVEINKASIRQASKVWGGWGGGGV